MEPLIISCALTGNVASAEDNPNLPFSPEAIGKDAVQAWRAGAAIVHIHARDDDGRPAGAAEYFARALEVVQDAEADVVINLTTSYGGGSLDQDEELRMVPLTLHPELASYDAGSINASDHVFMNTRPYLRKLAARMKESGTKPEIEVFDTGMIETARVLADEGLIDTPLFFQFVLGMRGGAPAGVRQLQHMVDSLPPDSVWSVCAIGRAQLPMNTLAIIMGGHARTGLEDNLMYERGVHATNAQLVERVKMIADIHGREVATPDQARSLLGLPTGDAHV